jgi:hypothetical protein
VARIEEPARARAGSFFVRADAPGGVTLSTSPLP